MSQQYWKEDLDASKAEMDKKKLEQDLMLANMIAEGKQRQAEQDFLIASSKIYKEESPRAAEIKQPMVAQPGISTKLSDMDYINEKIAKMTSPEAAEIEQSQVAQIEEQVKKSSRQILEEYLARMTSPSAAEQPTIVQPDYPDEYKPRSR